MMKLNIPDEVQQLATATYRIVRQQVIGIKTISVLHIDDNFSFIVQGSETMKPEKIWAFDIGTEKTARDFFNRFPPTPGEVENAINFVEDELMPVFKLLTPGSGIYSTDKKIREIFQYAGFKKNQDEFILTRVSMESIFSRLAAIITGLPASQDELPASTAFAATLLILREVMHHFGFIEISFIK
jgi:exopolyphosphatase/pppGpp-phosphohydrolase